MSDDAEQAPKASGKGKLIAIIAGVAVLVGGITAGAMMAVLGGKDEGGKDDKEVAEAADGHGEDAAEEDGGHGAEGEGGHGAAAYVSLAPSFVVNFQSQKSRARFLKVDLDALSKAPTAAEAVKTHMPAIRNAVVMLLSSQSYDDLITPEGKEKLRGEVLGEVQRVLEAQTGEKVVDDIYFTSFVMQ